MEKNAGKYEKNYEPNRCFVERIFDPEKKALY